MSQVTRGHRAKAIIEDEIFDEAFKAVHAEIHKAWESSPLRDTEGQQQLRMMLGCLQKVRGHIEQVMLTGKMEEIQLERQSKLGKIFNW